jgi:hypothetical protein
LSAAALTLSVKGSMSIEISPSMSAAAQERAQQEPFPAHVPTLSTAGQNICLWSAPVVGAIWGLCFLLFPAFNTPLSPELSADAVAAFYADPEHLARARYSMIVFNWFGIGFLPFYGLITVQMKRMAHNTEVFAYAFLGTATSAATLMSLTILFFQVLAFRPDRDPAMVQLANDLAWLSFTVPVSFLMAQAGALALGIYLDRQRRPIYPRWVAHFNVLAILLLAPAVFASTDLRGPFAWNGIWSFWVRIATFSAWTLVMFFVAMRAMNRLSEEPQGERS